MSTLSVNNINHDEDFTNLLKTVRVFSSVNSIVMTERHNYQILSAALASVQVESQFEARSFPILPTLVLCSTEYYRASMTRSFKSFYSHLRVSNLQHYLPILTSMTNNNRRYNRHLSSSTSSSSSPLAIVATPPELHALLHRSQYRSAFSAIIYVDPASILQHLELLKSESNKNYENKKTANVNYNSHNDSITTSNSFTNTHLSTLIHRLFILHDSSVKLPPCPIIRAHVNRTLYLSREKPGPSSSSSPPLATTTTTNCIVRRGVVIRHTPSGALNARERRDPSNRLTLTFQRVHAETSTLLTSKLITVLIALEKVIFSNDHLQAPLNDRMNLDSWIPYIKQLQLSSLSPSSYSLLPWYIALRVLVLSWETADWAVISLLKISQCHDRKHIQTEWGKHPKVLDAIRSFWAIAPNNLQVLFRLRRELTARFVGIGGGNFNKNNMASVLVVVDLPPLVDAVMDFLTDQSFSELGIVMDFVFSVEEGEEWNNKMTDEKILRTIQAFQAGDVNTLITTRTFWKENEPIDEIAQTIRIDSAVWWGLSHSTQLSSRRDTDLNLHSTSIPHEHTRSSADSNSGSNVFSNSNSHSNLHPQQDIDAQTHQQPELQLHSSSISNLDPQDLDAPDEDQQSKPQLHSNSQQQPLLQPGPEPPCEAVRNTMSEPVQEVEEAPLQQAADIVQDVRQEEEELEEKENDIEITSSSEQEERKQKNCDDSILSTPLPDAMLSSSTLTSSVSSDTASNEATDVPITSTGTLENESSYSNQENKKGHVDLEEGEEEKNIKRELLTSHMPLGPEILEPGEDGIPLNPEAKRAIEQILVTQKQENDDMNDRLKTMVIENEYDQNREEIRSHQLHQPQLPKRTRGRRGGHKVFMNNHGAYFLNSETITRQQNQNSSSFACHSPSPSSIPTSHCETPHPRAVSSQSNHLYPGYHSNPNRLYQSCSSYYPRSRHTRSSTPLNHHFQSTSTVNETMNSERLRFEREREKQMEKRFADELSTHTKNPRSTLLSFAGAVGATVDVKHIASASANPNLYLHQSVITFTSGIRHIVVRGYASSPIGSEASAAEKLVHILKELIIQ